MTGQLTKQMAGDLVWSGFGKIVSSLCTFGIALILTRAISPTKYGEFSIAISTIVIVAGVGTLGMDQVVIRFASLCLVNTYFTKLKNIIWRCLNIVLIATTITCIIFFLWAPSLFRLISHIHSAVAFVVIITIWVFFSTLQRQLSETYRGLNDIKYATIFGGVRSSGILNGVLTCVAMSLLWVSGNLTLVSALLVMAATSALISGVAALLLRWRLRTPRVEQTRGAASVAADTSVVNLLREGWPLWLATLLGTLNAAGIMWLAGAMDTSAHVALLGVGQRLMALIVAPMMVLNAVLPPIIAKLYASHDVGRLQRVVRASAGILLLPSLAIFLLLVVLGRDVLLHAFGPFYGAAYPILLVLCMAQLVNIAGGAWEIVLPMTGYRYEALAGYVGAAATQALFGILLGLRYGVLGVTVGFCMSSITSNVLGVLLVRWRLGVWTIASIDRQALREAMNMIATRFEGRHA